MRTSLGFLRANNRLHGFATLAYIAPPVSFGREFVGPSRPRCNGFFTFARLRGRFAGGREPCDRAMSASFPARRRLAADASRTRPSRRLIRGQWHPGERTYARATGCS